MDLPNVLHPTKFSDHGVVFAVKTYEAITDTQAAQIVRQYVRSHRIPKSARGTEIIIYSLEGSDR